MRAEGSGEGEAEWRGERARVGLADGESLNVDFENRMWQLLAGCRQTAIDESPENAALDLTRRRHWQAVGAEGDNPGRRFVRAESLDATLTTVTQDAF